MSLKSAHDGKLWYEWEKGLVFRDKKSLLEAQKKYKDEISFWKFVQFKFFEQWFELKKYANLNGVEIIGDIPIYAARDSVEAWSAPELFQLDETKTPISVAGCPPDDFSPLGQLWGNPLYDWDYHNKDNFSWWINRVRFALKAYDIVRIDHFRGFEGYYSIPYEDKTAENGKWCKAPGAELFKQMKKQLGKMNIIAEDLGFVTPEVKALLKQTGFPGMKVLEFAFDNPQNTYLPHNYENKNCVVYTGTHDNETLKGWVYSSTKKSVKFCKEYIGAEKKKELTWALIRLAWSSVAEISIAQIQDFLELDNTARMNMPSTTCNNWQFRTVYSDFTPALIKKIRCLNTLYNRTDLKTKKQDKTNTKEKDTTNE
jgi:4-alpha-glucanotransferase